MARLEQRALCPVHNHFPKSRSTYSLSRSHLSISSTCPQLSPSPIRIVALASELSSTATFTYPDRQPCRPKCRPSRQPKYSLKSDLFSRSSKQVLFCIKVTKVLQNLPCVCFDSNGYIQRPAPAKHPTQSISVKGLFLQESIDFRSTQGVYQSRAGAGPLEFGRY
jgi:hypothetical protein